MSTGNRIERCLSYDEKPLLLFQKLKDAKKNPVFMLKHIKDIRSPIAVAQQKHAARKASSIMTTDTTMTSATLGHHKAPSTSRTHHRPPKLEVQDLSAPMPALTGVSPQPGWPDSGILSPSVEKGDELSLAPISAGPQSSHSSSATMSSTSTLLGSSPNIHDKPSGTMATDPGDHSVNHGITTREIPVPSAGVSYAVAIYPYMAEQDDEFDVVV